MSEITQYKFDLTDIAYMLLEKQGIVTGKWRVGFGFTITAADAGPSKDQARPSMVLSVDHVLLSESTEDNATTVDASKIPKIAAKPMTKVEVPKS